MEEFEDLVDELLFKLSAFSNSLHHNLPNKETGFGSPFSSQSGWSCNSESDVMNAVCFIHFKQNLLNTFIPCYAEPILLFSGLFAASLTHMQRTS